MTEVLFKEVSPVLEAGSERLQTIYQKNVLHLLKQLFRKTQNNNIAATRNIFSFLKTFFWVKVARGLAGTSRRFGKACCIHLQG
jgi:hypothetical protein